MNPKNIDGNPEFGYELACTLPYAYYLHTNNILGKVTTSLDMKPFYYFTNDINEVYNFRSVDNNVALKDVPNKWIYHNAVALTGKDYNELSNEEKLKVNGVLDYREWLAPPLKEYYVKNNEIDEFDQKVIIICNVFSMPHLKFPIGYFDIPILQEILEYLINKNYTIIYKRPENTEFTLDLNEQATINVDLINKYGIKAVDATGKVITDKQVCKLYKNVYLMDDILKKYSNLSYNTFQLKLFSKACGFISYGGGNSILCSYFNSPVISYVTGGAEFRENFFNDNGFYKKLSNADVFPIKESKFEIEKRGYREYPKLIETIKSVF